MDAAAKRLLRSPLRCAVRIGLRLRSRPLPLTALPSALVIAPHPDDETFGMGGTLARLGRAGIRPHVVFVTDGAASHPGHPRLDPGAIAARRGAEAERALAALGIDWDRVTRLGGPDGRLDRLAPAEADTLVAGLRAAAGRAAARLVFLAAEADGSSEHAAAYALAARAFPPGAERPRLLEYPVWAWWSPPRLRALQRAARRVWRSGLGECRGAKAAAIAAYASQTEPLAPQTEAALPPGFAASFDTGAEYFFER